MKIVEEYDGRLPVFKVLDSNDNTLGEFDSFDDAQRFIDDRGFTTCGEENPC